MARTDVQAFGDLVVQVRLHTVPVGEAGVEVGDPDGEIATIWAA
jgi:hypothetical protein